MLSIPRRGNRYFCLENPLERVVKILFFNIPFFTYHTCSNCKVWISCRVPESQQELSHTVAILLSLLYFRNVYRNHGTAEYFISQSPFPLADTGLV